MTQGLLDRLAEIAVDHFMYEHACAEAEAQQKAALLKKFRIAASVRQGK